MPRQAAKEDCAKDLVHRMHVIHDYDTGLTAMGKVKYALSLSLFHKIVYMICICILPLFLDIRYIFMQGRYQMRCALYSVILFWGIINRRIRSELSKERIVRHG